MSDQEPISTCPTCKRTSLVVDFLVHGCPFCSHPTTDERFDATPPDRSVEEIAKQLHGWYLEATKELNPENYNAKAQVAYDDMNEEQKEIDRYIARKVLSLHHQGFEAGRREERERIREWSIKELGFIHEQLETEPEGEVREYLIGQRNKLYNLQLTFPPLATLKHPNGT